VGDRRTRTTADEPVMLGAKLRLTSSENVLDLLVKQLLILRS